MTRHLGTRLTILTTGSCIAVLLLACEHKNLNGVLAQSELTPDTENETPTEIEPMGTDWGQDDPFEVIVNPEDPVDETKSACSASGYLLPYTEIYEPDPKVLEKVEEYMSIMSPADKAGQMRGTAHEGGENWGRIFEQPDNMDLQIRGFQFRDGPRGLNLAAELPNDHLGFSTAFPVTMSRGATFDLDLEYRIGEAQGHETLASRNTMLLAPTVNLLRHPAWGRAQESYGEDPYHLGRMGSVYTVGVQEYIPACVKHFIANNVEENRHNLDAIMDEQTLREIYGRAYEMIVQDSGVACVMGAYNPVNGVKSCQNRHILIEILRNDFGFKGLVLSDWWAMTNGADAGKRSGEYSTIAIAGVEAGMDLELPWGLNYEYIEALLDDQSISISDVDASVRRILEQKFRFSVGDRTDKKIGLKETTVEWDRSTSSIRDHDEHIALAEEAAVKGSVLLKNADNTLPIDRSKVSKVVVLGATVPYPESFAIGHVNYANDVLTGDLGSSRVFADPALSASPFAGIKEIAGNDVDVTFSEDPQDAEDADFVVVVAGLNSADEGEDYTGAGDRPSFDLDAKISGSPQNDLIFAASELKIPMAVVLIGGSAISMPWLNDVPAVLMAWYPGMVGGRAIGKLLFGDESPSGKLPFTWPKSWDDEPDFNGDKQSVFMDYFAGYRRFEQEKITPLYPFGHGLSYATFEYSNIAVPCSTVTAGGVIKAKVNVTNTGQVPAEEVVMAFVAYPESADERRQVKQLKSFYRVSLDPGVTKQVMLPIRMNDLRFWNDDTKSWEVEKGDLEIMMGSSADNLPETDIVVVE